MTSLLTVKAGG